MNLWFRLLRQLLALLWRPRLEPPLGVSRLHFRVMPTDLDVNLHVNNGRYLTIADLGRVDMMIRMGLLKVAARHGWAPVLSAANVRFRRELRLWEKFELESSVVGWRDAAFVMQHRFRFTAGNRQGAIAATVLVKGGFYDRKARAFVTMDALSEALGITASESPPFTAAMDALLNSEEAIRDSDRADAQADGVPASDVQRQP